MHRSTIVWPKAIGVRTSALANHYFANAAACDLVATGKFFCSVNNRGLVAALASLFAGSATVIRRGVNLAMRGGFHFHQHDSWRKRKSDDDQLKGKPGIHQEQIFLIHGINFFGDV